MYVKLLFLVGGWVGEEKTKLMLYSTLVEVKVEVEVEHGNEISSFRGYLINSSTWVEFELGFLLGYG